METKKDVAIVFGFTSNFVFAVACVMMDLKKFSPNWIDEIVIIHDGLSEKNRNLLNNILPCRFIRYKFPIFDKSKFNKETFNYFSKMVFSKFECLKLLDDYKNVVWLDYDIVVTQDISELTNYSNSGIKMMFPSGCNVFDQLHSPINHYVMNVNGMCGSTFVLQDHLQKYIDMYKFCYLETEKYAKYLKLGEQAIFDFMIQKFKLNVSHLDFNIYSVHPKEIDKILNAKIIHSGGALKFWNEIPNKQWNYNYNKWLKMGGSKYNLNKYLFKKWLTFFLKKIKVFKIVKNFILIIKRF